MTVSKSPISDNYINPSTYKFIEPINITCNRTFDISNLSHNKKNSIELTFSNEHSIYFIINPDANNVLNIIDKDIYPYNFEENCETILSSCFFLNLKYIKIKLGINILDFIVGTDTYEIEWFTLKKTGVFYTSNFTDKIKLNVATFKQNLYFLNQSNTKQCSNYNNIVINLSSDISYNIFRKIFYPDNNIFNLNYIALHSILNLNSMDFKYSDLNINKENFVLTKYYGNDNLHLNDISLNLFKYAKNIYSTDYQDKVCNLSEICITNSLNQNLLYKKRKTYILEQGLTLESNYNKIIQPKITASHDDILFNCLSSCLKLNIQKTFNMQNNLLKILKKSTLTNCLKLDQIWNLITFNDVNENINGFGDQQWVTTPDISDYIFIVRTEFNSNSQIFSNIILNFEFNIQFGEQNNTNNKYGLIIN